MLKIIWVFVSLLWSVVWTPIALIASNGQGSDLFLVVWVVAPWIAGVLIWACWYGAVKMVSSANMGLRRY